MLRQRTAALFVLLATLAAAPMAGQVVTHADLTIQGSGLELVESAVTVQLGATGVVHTRMAGLQDDAAPPANGLSAVGDLVGPGITTPVKVVTAPGHAFQITGLSQEGVYYLQNVRLMNGADVLQLASPSVCAIQVANVLDTKVTVRQLSPDELRARGITLDPTNYDVYEYTFSFLIDGKTVQIPYPVIINKITHEVTQPPTETPYTLPADTAQAPPRWIPPTTIGTDLLPELTDPGMPPKDPTDDPPKPKPQIHAAIVIPNSLAVLHQFFAVALIVTNGAPATAGSSVRLDSITANIDIPNRLRVAKSDPPAPFGQPLTITDPNTGATFLIAQAQGKAEWTLEGLKPGTYTIDLDVKATLRSDGQPDLPLEAKPKASIVIHDPRFSITFAHPDTIRKGLAYTTTTYVTNISDDAQTITLSDQGLPECSKGGYVANVCRVDGYPASNTVTIPPGETRAIPYKLQSSLTGHIYATAASIDGTDSAITAAAFELTMGVSETGVPLSPATLHLPYYARTPYFSQDFLDAQLGYLGVAYSLATAPLTKQTARFPRLIPSDVFTRAVDLARAGERMFIGEDQRASLSTMTLDQLGNSVPLAEWDAFLRQQFVDPAGIFARDAMTSFGAELSAGFGKADGTFNDMADRFAGSTTDRGPYVFALVHASKGGAAAQPFAVQIQNAAAQTLAGAPKDGAWKRDLPWGQLYPLDATGEGGTLAVVGRSNEALDLTVTPAAGGSATLDLIIPAADGVRLVRASATFTAAANQPVHVHIEHGVATGDQGITFSSHTIELAPLTIVGARQDLNLDGDGHVVSVLFNRRLMPDAADQSPKFDTDVSLDQQKFGVTFSGKRVVAGAAQQQDLRIIRLNYENGLSNDAQYLIHVNGILDAGTPNTVRPIVEDRSSALIYGTVLRGDNTVVSGAAVKLTTGSNAQWGTSDQDGHFLFEYVPRDPDRNVSGAYALDATAEGKEALLFGSVRLLHTLNKISLVFLGRGSAQGIVRYDNGTPVANARVVVGSSMFNVMRTATTKTDGSYSVADVPVGPLTFSAIDASGNVAYAANELRAGGQVLLQDITIYKKQYPGIGAVRGRIYRSDTNQPAANVHVGVSSQGFGLTDGYTDSNGAFYFAKVPAGFVTVLGADFSIAPVAIAVDFDLQAGETHDVGTLYLAVPNADELTTVEGNITAERVLQPGAFDPVPSAQVQMEGMPLIVADAQGHYIYNAVPLSAAGREIQAIDPVTRRGKRINVPSLDPPTPAKPSNNLPITITNDSGLGTGTIRVHLLSQSGVPVDGYHVFEPGFPTIDAVPAGPGVYEFTKLPVGRSLFIMAAPSGLYDPTYGYQYAQGSGSVAYTGQIAAVTLRLPGQGTLSAHIEQQTQAGVNVRLIGKVDITFRHWNDDEQELRPITLHGTTDNANDAVFPLTPVRETVLVETVEMAGYAYKTASMPYDGSRVPVTLTLGTLSEIRGHVYGADGYTPVAGAKVHVVDNAQDLGYSLTGIDGSFVQKNVVPGSGFNVTADYFQNGIYRTALVSGSTPSDGRPVDVSLILMKQGSVDGVVVDANNNPVPFARIWLRELSYPSRPFGFDDPLFADGAGHFRFNNIFTVGVRMTALDPNNPESRGDWSGVVTDEGAVTPATIVVGSIGTGSLRVTVRDPNNGFAPVANAEVAIYKGKTIFDFGTTDGSGVVQFDQLPVNNYDVISAYSKSIGRSGSVASFSIAKNLTTAVNIDLEFSGEVKGTLTDPQAANAGVPATSVTLYANIYNTRTTTDTTGAFDFLGIREGDFRLEARDPNSIRMARGTGAIDSANPTFTTALTLEPTSTLTVKAFLPNDTGGSSGVLAPLVTIDVHQAAQGGNYLRSSQTNGAQFAGLVRNRPGANQPFHVDIHEVGGLGRYIGYDGSFPADVAASELDVVFTAFGTVEVTVVKSDPPVPAADILVTASGQGGGRSAYTDATGIVTLGGIPLGNVTVQARNTSGSVLTGSAALSLTSQTQTAKVTIQLGSYSSITGTVLAEGGTTPSAGTRVLAQYSPTGGSGVQLETRTDSTGSYTFLGIATQVSGTSVTLTYLGPDDATIGARQSVAVANGAGTVTAPTVTLDSTPPLLLAVFPADGTTKVAPDTKLKFTFNRQIRPDQLTSGFFQLWDSSTNKQLTLTLSGDPVIQDNRSEVITFAPPAAPAGQRYPLKSNTLYRIVISGQLQDLAGHQLGPDLGTSFTTSDYSAPQVVKVTPLPSQPLPKNGFRLGVTFSKTLDKTPWQPGGNGVMQFVPINGIGGTVIGAPVAGQIQLDADTNATLYFAPDIELPASSYYRLSVSGVIDTDGRAMIDASGNTLSVFTQDFFTYDNGAPVVAINNPKLNGTTAIGDTDPLYNNASYTIGVTLTNSDGSAVTDLSDVKFYTVDPVDGTLTQIRNATATTVVITPLPGTTTFKLRADATDLSGNKGTATRSWSVTTQAPLVINSTAVTPSSAYPSNKITDTVKIGGGGLEATVTVTATVKGTALAPVSGSVHITRGSFTDPWPDAVVSVTIPATAPAGAQVDVTAAATDLNGHSSPSKTDSVTVATDTNAPVSQPLTIQVVTGHSATVFNDKDSYRVHAFASDGESGVASMTFVIENVVYAPIKAGDPGSTLQANGVWEFVSPLVPVQAHNDDATVDISAKALDYAGNASSASTTVTYTGIHDPNAPAVAWMAPLHDAAWPANVANFTTRLRVYAASPVTLIGSFEVPGLGTLQATRSGTELYADITADQHFTTPADGTKLAIIAHVQDDTGGHKVDLTINVDVVAVGQTIPPGATVGVDDTHPLNSDSVYVDGGHLVLHIPVTLKNLIVLHGGSVESGHSTTTSTQKLDLTVADHLYVDDTSSVDVSARGYVGGLAANADNSGNNPSAAGRTLGNVDGATTGASGSYAGIGGDDAGATNATYGSITAPNDLGSGGAADSSNRAGGQGGGAAYIHTTSSGLGNVVVAGKLLADGESGVPRGGAGSGGSIHVAANEVVLGAASSVSANGGDDGDGSPVASRAGGGGRISIEAAALLDIDAVTGAHLSARGGRNTSPDNATVLDGGAGTIFLRNAGEAYGELLVSSLDTRYTDPHHLTRATPLGGTLVFDKVTLGARALARADAPLTIGGVQNDKTKAGVDASAVLLLPADVPTLTFTAAPQAPATLGQGSAIAVTYTATSIAGIGSVTYSLAPSVVSRTDAFAYPATATQPSNAVLTIPANAPVGDATFTARATDRAGRTADGPTGTYTITLNQVPVLTDFTLNVPSPLYIGGSFTAAVSATDDVAVKTLTVTAAIGGSTIFDSSVSPNATPASNTFTVPVPRQASYDGQTISVTAKASDGVAAPVTSTKTVTIAHDALKPVITITDPNANTVPYLVADQATKKIHVVATVVDAESGVKADTISVSLQGGETKSMTATGTANQYAADLSIPTVTGSATVTRSVTVTASDVVGNVQSAVGTVQITPIYDATSPILTWNCGSDGAIVAAGTTLPLSVTVLPGATGTAIDKSTITYDFGDGNGPHAVTESPSGSNVYPYTYNVPANASGTINITVSAKSIGTGVGTLLSAVTVATFDKTVSSDTTIQASDTTTYDGKDVLVTGGALTINGTHSFRKLVVLGGSVVPKSADLLHPDTLTVGTLYVACGASLDASSYTGAIVGFPRNVTYPGAGMAVFDSGGGHIGRGGPFVGRSFQPGAPGGTYGSVYHPLEPGSGGQDHDPANATYAGSAGGGVLRLVATSVLVDGSLLANGQESATFGEGAGGSVYITTGSIGGGGQIQAKGANWQGTSSDSAAGGGGAIAIEYTSASGTILNRLAAISGATTQQPAAAGSVYLFGPSSTYGDLTVDNGSTTTSLPASVFSELPPFGIANVLSVSAPNVAVVDAMWEPSYLAGNWLQVTGSDGVVRDKWRITSVANDAGVRTVNGAVAVPTQSVAYNAGYLLYSDAGHLAGGQTAHILAVRNNAGAWQYDDGTAFQPLSPQTGDVLFATFTATATAITSVQTFACPAAVCAPISGFPTAAVVRGDVMMNAANGTWLAVTTPTYAPVYTPHSFLIHPDDDLHGFVLSTGPATVTLESGADVRAGDVVRGLYRFDSLTVKNARLYTPDLVDLGGKAPTVTNSTYVPGNAGAPVVTSGKISVVPGFHGPVVSGSVAAVTDGDGSAELYVRNTTRPAQAVSWTNNAKVTFGTKGGFSVKKVPTGQDWGAYAHTLTGSTQYGYIEGRVSQTDKQLDMLLTSNAVEGAEYDWGIFPGGSCQVWVNGSPASSTFGYTTNSLFRIERTPTTVYFYLDGVLMWKAPTDSRPRYAEVAFKHDSAEINSIDFAADPPARFSAVAAGDGSFSVPVYGSAGDALTIAARDRHVYPMTSAPLSIGTIPASAVIVAPALSPNPATGGHTVVGTITLGSAAPSGGVEIFLSSSSTLATVPASVTIPQGATTATFNITTQVVSGPQSATITAYYGGVTYATTLSLVVDNIPPSLTLTSPAATPTPSYLEGSGQITVQATATDSDSGLASVVASIDGTPYPMTAPNGSSVYSATITAPFIDSTTPLTKQLTVTATDRQGNSTPASVNIIINPVTDSTPPTVAWSCMGDGALLPTAYSTKLRVTALPSSASNAVQSVTFSFDDGTGSVPASPAGNNVYEASWTTPAAAKTVTVTATALAAGGGSVSLPASLTVVAADLLINNTQSISATNTQWDTKVVAVAGPSAVASIDGQHNFAKLLVLDGAKVVETSGVTNPLSLGTKNAPTDVYVGCTASIDVSGRGYGPAATYPSTGGPGNGSGGSHIGIGGLWDTPAGVPFGSILQPREAGGGGDLNSGSNYGQPGGGVLQIVAGKLIVDGALRADGQGVAGGENRGGAGGSLWLTATSIGGKATLSAQGGGAKYGSGGGGAISVNYGSLLSGTALGWTASVAGGPSLNSRFGGPGSIYVQGGTALGNLSVTEGFAGGQSASLATLGGGTALAGSSGTTLVTDRGTDIPNYFIGHWVEITDANGTLKGTWRVAAIPAARTVTLAQNGNETINVIAGDKWQGVYRFDSVSGDSVVLSDPIHNGTSALAIAGPTAANQYLQIAAPIVAGDVTITGNVSLTSITAANVTVKSGAKLMHPVPLNGVPYSLIFNVSGTVTVETGGSIDVSGLGYGPAATYPVGATGPGNGSGGSHLGTGGLWDRPTGTTFGSVVQPREAGGGGDLNSGGGYGQPGGGVLQIGAGTLVNNGTIKADGGGTASGEQRGGAGGSIWINATNVDGTGTVSVQGGGARYGSGGGGAISLTYTNAVNGTAVGWHFATAAGPSLQGHYGGSGTLYVKAGSSPNGELTVDDGALPGAQATVLPSFGSGTALAGTAGSTLVTGSTAIPQYFAGHWLEITDANGVAKGTWRIAKVLSPAVTLTANGNETISLVPGDKWQGVYRFDTLHLPSGDALQSTDPIRLGVNNSLTLAGPTTPGQYLELLSPINTSTVTLTGNLSLVSVTADTVTVKSGATLTHPMPANGVPNALAFNVSGTLTIEGGATIDTTGRGYPAAATYPGTTGPNNGDGGAHIGHGGLWDGPLSATFGSVVQPREAGGGGDLNNGSSNYGRPGGGVVQITAGTLVHNGTIKVDGDGATSGEQRGGAGGSVWITATNVGGTGSISAQGGSAKYGSGGGGAISINYHTLLSGSALGWFTIAQPGPSLNGKLGGAGTLYVDDGSTAFGKLTVGNGGATVQATELPSFGIGAAAAGSSGSTLVTGRSSDIPTYFKGHWVEITGPAGNVKGLWRIGGFPSARTVTLTPNGTESIDIQPGDGWRGVYRFATVTLHGGTLQSKDRIDGTQAADGGGRIVFNTARPAWDQTKVAQITITPTTTGNANIVAPANTINDTDLPLTVVATKVGTSQTTAPVTASSGGFTIPVAGVPGDSFVLVATDSHTFPLSSLPVTVAGWPAPVTVSSVTVSPASVNGTASATGTVTLSAAAPGNTPVTLSSNAPVASVPASVTVASGQTSATFAIATTNPGVDTNATITGTLGGSQGSQVLVVHSVAVAAGLTPSSVIGGQSSTGTVTLSAPAAVPVTIGLTSSSANATVPASVSIAAGQTSATFTVTTTVPASNTSSTITATYGGTQGTASLGIVVNGLASVTVAAPTTVAGGTTLTGTVQLAAAATSNTVVTLTSSNAHATVPANVTVAAGSSTASFSITSTAVSTDTPVTITAALNGTQVTANLTLIGSPFTISIPNPMLGGTTITGKVTLTAAAADPITITFTPSGPPSAAYAQPITIPAGQLTANFSVVSDSLPASDTSLTFTAFNGLQQASAPLTVKSFGISSVVLAPNDVPAGVPSVATITLTAPAPSATTIVLSQNNPAGAPIATYLTLPPNIVIPAGQSSATLTIPTDSPATSPIVMTVNFIGNGVRTSLPLTIEPRTNPLAITSSMVSGDPNYQARRMAVTGTTLAVASMLDPGPSAVGSDKVVLFDITNPTHPVYQSTIALGNNVWIYDITFNGRMLYAFTPAGIYAVSLDAPTVITNVPGGVTSGVVAPNGKLYAIAQVSGATPVQSYSLGNPATPQLLSSFIAGNYSAVAVVGTHYVAAVATTKTADGRDLVIGDTNNGQQYTLALPAGGTRMVANNNRLAIASVAGGVMSVDVTDPTHPSLVTPSYTTTAGASQGIDADGTTAAMGDANGTTFVATETGAAVTSLATGNTWDVKLVQGGMIAAVQSGLYVTGNDSMPMMLDPSKITAVFDSDLHVTITGTAGAVRGLTSPGRTGIGIVVGQFFTDAGPVLWDGSFSVGYTGSYGQSLIIFGYNRNNGSQSAPLTLGAFPDAALSSITSSMSDATFAPRQLAVAGNNLIVAARTADGSSSDKLVVYDISNAANPVYSRTLVSPTGAINRISASGTWLVVGGANGIATYDFRVSPPAVSVPATQMGAASAVAVQGTLIAACSNHNVNGGFLDIYDLLSMSYVTGGSGFNFTYAAPCSGSMICGAGTNAATLLDLDPSYTTYIPTGFSSTTSTSLFLADKTNAYVANGSSLSIYDRTTKSLRSTYAPGATIHGLDVSGQVVAVANDGNTLRFVNVATPAAPTQLASRNTLRTWDVKMVRGVAYVAVDGGIRALTNLPLPPAVDSTAIAATTDGATTATVTGSAGAVTTNATSVSLQLATGSATANPIVASGGSFPATAVSPAAPGATIAATATDSYGTTNVNACDVPFANAVDTFTLTAALQADTNAHFRKVVLDGTRLVAAYAWPYTPWPSINTGKSDAIYVFDSTRALAGQTPLVYHAGSPVQAFDVANGFAFVAANDFVTIDLSNGTAHHVALASGNLNAIAVAGNYAYAGHHLSSKAIAIDVYDVSNPSSPQFINEQVLASGVEATGIRPYGTSSMVILSEAGQKFWTVDRTTPSALQVLGSRTSSGYPGDGIVVGTTLYAFSDYDGVRAFDLSNPALPAVIGSGLMTLGAARQVALSGTNELVVADTAHGITFLDITNPAAMVIKGHQVVPGAAEGVFVAGNKIYVAADHQLNVLTRP